MCSALINTMCVPTQVAHVELVAAAPYFLYSQNRDMAQEVDSVRRGSWALPQSDRRCLG